MKMPHSLPCKNVRFYAKQILPFLRNMKFSSVVPRKNIRFDARQKFLVICLAKMSGQGSTGLAWRGNLSLIPSFLEFLDCL